MNTLTQIKRLALAGRIILTTKADLEMTRDGITLEMVREAIVAAAIIQKSVRSKSPLRRSRETLHVILGQTWSGIIIYTKGKVISKNGKETFYVLISSKRSLD